MKKKVLLLFIASFLLVNVVSAAGIWGTYKGNNIIELTVDGKSVDVSDVPAINYGGRTMIPIYLLQQAGINYSWDQDSQTVNITKPVVTSVGTKSLLKQYSYAANQYLMLNSLSEIVFSVSRALSLGIDGMRLNKPDYLYNTALEKLNKAVDDYNTMLKTNESAVSQLEKDSIYIYDTNNILTNLYNAIEAYKKAYTSITNYYNNSSSTGYDDYFTHAVEGDELINTAKTMSWDGYWKFYSLTQK